MTVPEVALSDFVQHPRATIARLHATRGRTLRLRRRGAEDLLLVTATRSEQAGQLTATSAGLLRAFADDEIGHDVLLRVLPKVFAWARYLPEPDVALFVEDLIETLRAADGLDNPAPLVQVITEWRHTAEVHADPELRKLLRSTTGDFGPVMPPEAT